VHAEAVELAGIRVGVGEHPPAILGGLGDPAGEEAGVVGGEINLVTIPVTLVIPWFADRVGSRRAYLVVSAAVLLAAEVGFVVAPGAAWLWAVSVGVAIGVMLPVQFTLPLDVEEDPERVAVLAALMLGAGYVLSSIGPSALGLLRDASGSFAATFWLLAVAGAALLAVSALLSAERLARPPVPEP
jgi:CP family cyanate transporter-like MFS transporter